MNSRVKLLPITLLTLPLASTHTAEAKSNSQQQMQGRPNVVIIYADDMGSGDIAAYNKASKIKTPNLDALARSGVRFTDAHTVSSVSTPSRYGLLTGEYSWRSSLKAGVTWGYSKPLIPSGKQTIASMMRRNGYKTACVGKWHLGWNWATTDGKPAEKNMSNVRYNKPITEGPTTRGFNYFYGLPASLDIPPFVTIENCRAENIPNGKLEKTTFTRKDDEVGENPFLRAGDYVVGEKPEMFMPKFTAKVKSLVSEYNDNNTPFFIYFALTAPHAPIAPNKQFEGKSKIGRYGDFVMEVDHTVGEVVKHLKKEGILDNTIIILSSDNGAEYFAYERLGDTGHNSSANYKGIKRDLWEGGHRVPLMISWQGKIERNKVVDKTVCISDIYATLCDIARYKRPEGEAQDSYSLVPLIAGRDGYKRDYTIHHSSSGRFAIRKDDWVLIEGGRGDDNGDDNKKLDKTEYYKIQGYTFDKKTPRGELFNLKDDPRQTKSLYNENPEKVAELTAILDKVTDGWKTKRDKYRAL